MEAYGNSTDDDETLQSVSDQLIDSENKIKITKQQMK